MRRLAAIYNCWDGIELLSGSMESIAKHIDRFIIVYQNVSNFGEKYDPLHDIIKSVVPWSSTKLIRYEPNLSVSGRENETRKNFHALTSLLNLNKV